MSKKKRRAAAAPPAALAASPAGAPSPKVSTSLFAAIVAYVALVLTVDALASLGAAWPFDWGWFQWRLDAPFRALGLAVPAWTRRTPADGADLFKLLFWFVIPFCLCLPRMEWSWFSPRQWRRLDWLLLAAMTALGGAAVLSIRCIPALRETYSGMSDLPWALRRGYGMSHLVWVAAWLPGWEFLHRYVLLRAIMLRLPKWGWLLVPLSEGLYHLQKPWIEALGMVLFSLALTWWSMKRRSLLLPFVAHLYIELLLILGLLFFL